MLAAHKGMKITDAEFTALVEDLVKSLDKFKVGARRRMSCSALWRHEGGYRRPVAA
jgi:hemoglobin